MSKELTSAEAAALKQFRFRIDDVLDKVDDLTKQDPILVRWLRARNLNVDKAEQMFRAHLEWRAQHGVDNLGVNPHIDLLLNKLPMTDSGHDKGGTMVGVIPFSLWDLKGVLDQGHESDLIWLVIKILEHNAEYTKRRLLSGEGPNSNFVIIVDLQNFSLTQVLSKQVISVAISILRLFDANYPESLKEAYIINVPRIFEIFWNLVNHVLSSTTLAKIKIVGGGPSKCRPILLRNIPPWDLPSFLGGTNTTLHWWTLAVTTLKGRRRAPDLYRFEWCPRAPTFPESEFKQVTIPAKEKFLQNFDLVPGDRITWNFKCESFDIGFEFLFKSVPLFPYARADAHLSIQDGLFDVTEAGTYSLIWDNTYSHYRAKVLHVAVCIGKTDVARKN